MLNIGNKMDRLLDDIREEAENLDCKVITLLLNPKMHKCRTLVSADDTEITIGLTCLFKGLEEEGVNLNELFGDIFRGLAFLEKADNKNDSD